MTACRVKVESALDVIDVFRYSGRPLWCTQRYRNEWCVVNREEVLVPDPENLEREGGTTVPCGWRHFRVEDYHRQAVLQVNQFSESVKQMNSKNDGLEYTFIRLA